PRLYRRLVLDQRNLGIILKPVNLEGGTIVGVLVPASAVTSLATNDTNNNNTSVSLSTPSTATTTNAIEMVATTSEESQITSILQSIPEMQLHQAHISGHQILVQAAAEITGPNSPSSKSGSSK
ncbi:hypothetical protein ACJMK2_033427, partial [Sinanodonta woodiana]